MFELVNGELHVHNSATLERGFLTSMHRQTTDFPAELRLTLSVFA